MDSLPLFPHSVLYRDRGLIGPSTTMIKWIVGLFTVTSEHTNNGGKSFYRVYHPAFPLWNLRVIGINRREIRFKDLITRDELSYSWKSRDWVAICEECSDKTLKGLRAKMGN